MENMRDASGASLTKKILLGIFLLASFGNSGLAQTKITYPETQGFVTDSVGLLKTNEKTELEMMLANFEKETSNEIAILIVNTTAPESIEQYSIHVTDEWKIGKKGLDNGVLFTIAVEDRAMRIEVGRGLEGPLPDSIAVKILNTLVRPQFQNGNFYEGIKAGTEAIMQIAKGEFDTKKLDEVPEDPVGNLLSILLFLIPFVLSFFAGFMAKSKSILAGGITGVITGGIAGVIASLSIGYLVMAILGGGFIGLFIDHIVSNGKKIGGGGGGFWGGGGRFGGGSGGGFGGFGGGSFSGGGGSSRW